MSDLSSLNKGQRACEVCHVVNDSGAYACAACGASMRLSPPKRPTPTLRAPVLSAHKPRPGDTLDLETELPDEDLEVLLARATPPPGVAEHLTTLDEATDGLAPSASFDELEAAIEPSASGHSARASLQELVEPAFHDQITIDPPMRFPGRSPHASPSKSRLSWLLTLAGVSALGAVAAFVLAPQLHEPTTPTPQAQGSNALQTQRKDLTKRDREPQEEPQKEFHTSSLRSTPLTPSLTPSLKGLLGAPNAPLSLELSRAQANAWVGLLSARVELLNSTPQEPQRDLSLAETQLTYAAALRFAHALNLSNESLQERAERAISEAQALLAPLLKLNASSAAESDGADRADESDEALKQNALALTLWRVNVTEDQEELNVLRSELRALNPQALGPRAWLLALPLLKSQQTTLLRDAYTRLSQTPQAVASLYALRAAEQLNDLTAQRDAHTRLSAHINAMSALTHPPQKAQKAKTKRAPQGPSQRRSSKPQGSYRALIKRGQRALEGGKASQARALFKKASELKPKSPEPLAQLGWCELARRAPKAALPFFKRALLLNARHGDSLYGLGYAYEQLNKSKEAQRYFERYLSLYPQGAKVRIIKNKLKRLAP